MRTLEQAANRPMWFGWDEIGLELVPAEPEGDVEWTLVRQTTNVHVYRSSRGHLSISVLARTKGEAAQLVAAQPEYAEWTKQD